MKQIVIFTFILFFSSQAFSQKIIKATSQGWSGGVCCASGTNYIVILEMNNTPYSIEIDKIYLQGNGELAGSIQPFANDTLNNSYLINFGISNNYEPYKMEDYDLKEIKKDDDTIPEFDGTALIILLADGIRIPITVENFEILMPIPYP